MRRARGAGRKRSMHVKQRQRIGRVLPRWQIGRSQISATATPSFVGNSRGHPVVVRGLAPAPVVSLPYAAALPLSSA